VIFAMHRAYHHTGNQDDAQDMRNMGGLKQYMPVTFWLMWIATLAIAGIPPFSGFFSKDEILGGLFARAQHSTIASASLFGIPGSGWLYFAYLLGLIAAFMTATYMTRMMIYTFHGPNRSGEKERGHLAEAPWIMTGPLVVLGVLTAIGGWLNLPEFAPLGKVGALEHWLDPVVGESTTRVIAGAGETSTSLEYTLVGLAVLIAIGGIALAWTRLKPEALVPKREAAPEECSSTSTMSTRSTTRRSCSLLSGSRAACCGAASTLGSSTASASTAAPIWRASLDGSVRNFNPASSAPMPGCWSRASWRFWARSAFDDHD
jgi:NADH:ubiquinone oxidoreductase subunit 5 (subunit L)/multisubunit Na+/H+ antiporter MnhA subunit